MSAQGRVSLSTQTPKATWASGHIGRRPRRPKATSGRGHVGPRPRRPKASSAQGHVSPSYIGPRLHRPNATMPLQPEATPAPGHFSPRPQAPGHSSPMAPWPKDASAKAASAQDRFGPRPLWLRALWPSLQCLGQLRFRFGSLCKKVNRQSVSLGCLRFG